ncbi:MAG: hypothetical protein H6565_04900 [Lewinellaceae bacterium]|nr:hypothetical protein [Lewinellaceae bacterium]
MWCLRSFSIAATACLFFFSCTEKETPRQVTPAFYYWQTTLDISRDTRRYLDSLGCRKLYVKLLDIGPDPAGAGIIPYSRLETADSIPLQSIALVPVFFIANEVFRDVSAAQIERLSEKVVQTLGTYPRLYGGAPFPAEVQFDCDWTPSTRAAFFDFLQKVDRRLPDSIVLSATIRLHQYKFSEQTGVPPVDRGMLMFYNTGDIEDPAYGNSIFTPADAEKYTSGTLHPYPLPLDLALPVFSWTLVYRDAELWKILPGMEDTELSDTTFFAPAVSNDLLQKASFSRSYVKKGTFRSGHYLRPGDLLRTEWISPATLLEAASLAAGASLSDATTVSFFHLEQTTPHRYQTPLLDSVCRIIRTPQKRE